MFERYTEKARRVIFFARYEASEFGSQTINPEHLLIGLFREDRGLMERVLPESHTSLHAMRQQVAQHASSEHKIALSVDLPLSKESRQVLLHAAEEAERLNHRFIGTDHLLLGLVREEDGVVAQILTPLRLDSRAIRKGIKDPASSEDRGYSTTTALYFGKHRGSVLSNADPEQLGRLMVQVPTVGNAELAWAVPCAPYPAGGTPTLAVPPVGTSVWVEFEGGKLEYPIWSGCFWSAGQPPLLKLPSQA